MTCCQPSAHHADARPLLAWPTHTAAACTHNSHTREHATDLTSEVRGGQARIRTSRSSSSQPEPPPRSPAIDLPASLAVVSHPRLLVVRHRAPTFDAFSKVRTHFTSPSRLLAVIHYRHRRPPYVLSFASHSDVRLRTTADRPSPRRSPPSSVDRLPSCRSPPSPVVRLPSRRPPTALPPSPLSAARLPHGRSPTRSPPGRSSAYSGPAPTLATVLSHVFAPTFAFPT